MTQPRRAPPSSDHPRARPLRSGDRRAGRHRAAGSRIRGPAGGCCGRRRRQLDRHLDGQPAAGLGGGLLRPGRDPARAAQSDAPPGRAAQHRRPAAPGRALQRVRRAAALDRCRPYRARRRGRRDRCRRPATPLTFSGQPSITIPPGAPIVSDPVDLAVPPLGSVAVDLYFPEISPTSTWHNEGAQTGYISAEGDFTGGPRSRPQRRSVPDLPQRDPVDADARCARDRDVRRFDHRWRRLDRRCQPPLARLPGRAPGQGRRRSRSSTRASRAPACCATGWATTRSPASIATC